MLLYVVTKCIFITYNFVIYDMSYYFVLVDNKCVLCTSFNIFPGILLVLYTPGRVATVTRMKGSIYKMALCVSYSLFEQANVFDVLCAAYYECHLETIYM